MSDVGGLRGPADRDQCAGDAEAIDPSRARRAGRRECDADASFEFPRLPVERRDAEPVVLDFENAPRLGDPLTIDPNDPFPMSGVLNAVSETAYEWDLTTDAMRWSDNAADVLHRGEQGLPVSAAAFNLLLASEHASARHDLLARAKSVPMQDLAKGAILPGVPYRLHFRFLPNGRRGEQTLWIEDAGFWYPGLDGKPQLARGVMRVVTERFQEEQRLLYLSNHDDLTGQLNRTCLISVLDTTIEASAETGQSCAVMLAAINNLAVINETFGFHVGDEVLTTVGSRLRRRMRAGDSIGRYSSNKFGLVLNSCDQESMAIAAKRFMDAIASEPIETSAGKVSATISIGGSVSPQFAKTSKDALVQSLEALDQARVSHHSTFSAYKPSERKNSERLRNLRIADEINSALRDNRMHLALQPVVNVDTGQPDFYECLLRMERSDGTIVPAGEFISVAEHLGLARQIDHRVLELAVTLLRKVPDLRLAMNVSGLTTDNRDWLKLMDSLLSATPEVANRLIVEITETAAINDLDECARFVDTLKEYGCVIALDDFGAGYTSFRNLRRLSVDIVKIDGSFVVNMLRSDDDVMFVKTLADLERHLGIQTVAEWVEDEATVTRLKDLQVDYLQGFIYGQPHLVRVNEIEAQAAA